MKINNIGLTGINPYKKQINKLDSIQKESLKMDKVEISTAAKQLQEVSPVTIERQGKVEALKQQIEGGTYQIDVKAIAKGVFNYYSKN